MSFSHHGQHQDNLKNSVLFQETLSDSDNIDINKSSIEEKLENPLKPTTEVTNEDSTSRMISNSLQSNANSDYSTWDLMIAKIDNIIVREVEENNHNVENSALQRFERLLCEIEQTLTRLQSLLTNCCSISFEPTKTSDCKLLSSNEHVFCPGENLSRYLKTLFCENEVIENDANDLRTEIRVRDPDRIFNEYLRNSLPQLQNCQLLAPRNNDLDEAKFVEEVLFKMDPESKISSNSQYLKSDDLKTSSINSAENLENVDSLNKELEQIESNKIAKSKCQRKSSKQLKKKILDQPCFGPPPPPIIREDGKKIYRKQKVVSGYFSHYPVSEDEYNMVIERGEPFICPPCQRKFKHRRSWEHHLNGRCLGMPLTKPNWYKRDGKFYCSHEGCSETASNKGWTTSYMVWVHFYRVHSPGGQLPHKCNLCDKSFAKIAQLRIHKESKHNINRKVCKVK